MSRKDIIINKKNTTQTDDSEIISESELEYFINESIKNIENKIESYIKKGKLDILLASKYLKIFEEILHKNFAGNGDEESYFAIIKNYLPELTKDAYSKEHKEIIEYLARIAKSRLRTLLKKEFISSEHSII